MAEYSLDAAIFSGTQTIPGSLQTVMKHIKRWKGLEGWTAREPVQIEATVRESWVNGAWVGGGLRANCYKVQFNREGGHRLFLYFCCLGTGRPQFNTEYNDAFMNNINTLAFLGYKTHAKMTLEQGRPGYGREPSGPIFVQHSRNNMVNGVKDGVKVSFRLRNGSATFMTDFEVRAKPRAAKHYTLVDSPYCESLTEAVKIADGEISHKKNIDYTKLPAPAQFDAKDFIDHEMSYDPRTQRRCAVMKGTLRNNILRTATVLDAGALHQDGSFSFDVNNPANENVWFVLNTWDYEARSHTIAFNDIGWYELSGRKYFKIMFRGCSLKLSPHDKELLTLAIKTWMDQQT